MSSTATESKTAPKRATAASKVSAQPDPHNDRLVLAAALTNITNRGDAFANALQEFERVRKSLSESLENEVQTKKRMRDELDTDYEQAKRAKQINLDQDIAQHGYQAALRLLAERKEVPILEQELFNLRKRIQELEAKDQAEMKKAIDEVKADAARVAVFEKRALTLQHEKEIASLTSNADSLQKQLAAAKDEIAKAEKRLDDTRALCQKIAEAGSKAQIVQNLGAK
jgi:chromosome segregation ATPase